MKLEVGKSYVAANGDVVDIIERGGNPDYPMVGSNGEGYTDDGKYYFLISDCRDLIHEHTPDKARLTISIDTTDMRAEMERVMRACQALIDEYDK